jgi:hypothetical protein
MLVVEVVPSVATTATGRRPAARSSAMAASRAAGSIRYSLSLATRRTLSRPKPRVIAPLSKEE